MTDIDPTAIKGDRICGDCGAVPGAYHMPGCDVERCGCDKGGRQAISCDSCTDEEYFANRIRWSGVWPGQLEAEHHGLFCHDLLDGEPEPDIRKILKAQEQGRGAKVQWHVPCGPDAVGAHPDLNRWQDLGCPPIQGSTG